LVGGLLRQCFFDAREFEHALDEVGTGADSKAAALRLGFSKGGHVGTDA
jgi:hypothetical protein